MVWICGIRYDSMKYIEIDVRGLSCPEPVMITMDAIEDNKGKELRVICDEAHTKANLEAMLKHQKIAFTTTQNDSTYTISFTA